jgi:hypothetical protein
MAQERKVNVFLNADGKTVSYTTSANTFGQLVDQLRQHELGSKKVVERTSKHVLEMEDAELPQGDFTIFVYPKKNKGGSANPFKRLTVDNIHTYGYNDIRKYGTWLKEEHAADIKLTGSRTEIARQIREWMIAKGWDGAVIKEPGKRSKAAKKFEDELHGKVNIVNPSRPRTTEEKLNYIISLLEPKKATPIDSLEPEELKDEAEEIARTLSDIKR